MTQYIKHVSAPGATLDVTEQEMTTVLDRIYDIISVSDTEISTILSILFTITSNLSSTLGDDIIFEDCDDPDGFINETCEKLLNLMKTRFKAAYQMRRVPEKI